MVPGTHVLTVTEDEREFAIKPMNCPGHVQIFKHGLRSYRELPYRVAEFGMVHRYEPSGALHGLMRVRGFTQDDAHVFCTEEQLADECIGMNELIMSIYRDFGFEKVLVKLATRPEKRVGSDALWDHAESTMSKVLQKIAAESGGKIRTGVNPGEGTFYGPKFEYVLRDAIGRDWQCGTIQVDFNLPERFGAFYIDADGEKKTPVMIHRAIFGSMERFAGILLENTAGHLPLWLAPVQVKVCTIVSDADATQRRCWPLYARRSARRGRICATRRSTTRCASTRSPRCRSCWWSASARPRRRPCRCAAWASSSSR
jgi:threonyl-tRNA synthetase